MKIIKHKFDREVKIVNLGDIHRGNPGCNDKFLRQIIKEIAEDPDCYWLSTGDLLEVATKHSVGNSHDAISTQREIDLLSEELLLIRNKCLGFVASNHHNRISKETGLSLDKMLASHAGLPYLGITGILNITIGQGSYFLCLHHGTGGGTVGNAINRAHKAAGIYKGCDLYLTGHTHKMDVHPFQQQIVDRKRNIIRTIQSYLVITGHCMLWEGSYAESMNLDPAPIGFARVTLSENINGREEGKSIKIDFLTC